jgi:hypothetical protein
MREPLLPPPDLLNESASPITAIRYYPLLRNPRDPICSWGMRDPIWTTTRAIRSVSDVRRALRGSPFVPHDDDDYVLEFLRTADSGDEWTPEEEAAKFDVWAFVDIVQANDTITVRLTNRYRTPPPTCAVC